MSWFQGTPALRGEWDVNEARLREGRLSLPRRCPCCIHSELLTHRGRDCVSTRPPQGGPGPRGDQEPAEV